MDKYVCAVTLGLNPAKETDFAKNHVATISKTQQYNKAEFCLDMKSCILPVIQKETVILLMGPKQDIYIHI